MSSPFTKPFVMMKGKAMDRGISELMADLVVRKMADLKGPEALKLLEGIDFMHITGFITWLGLELNEHADCPDKCPFKSPKKVAESYIEQFSTGILESVKATCEANGITYDPIVERDKEVRDEILREMDD